MAAAGQRRNRSRRTLSNHRLRWLDPPTTSSVGWIWPLGFAPCMWTLCGVAKAVPAFWSKQPSNVLLELVLILCIYVRIFLLFMRNLLLNRSERATILGESLPPSIAVLSPKWTKKSCEQKCSQLSLLTVLLLVEYPISTKGIFRHPTNPVGCLRGVPLLSIWSANARPSRLVAWGLLYHKTSRNTTVFYKIKTADKHFSRKSAYQQFFMNQLLLFK